jgi:hypothetical protein
MKAFDECRGCLEVKAAAWIQAKRPPPAIALLLRDKQPHHSWAPVR